MPVPDVDSGMTWQGFSPRVITDRLPKETYQSVPFRFGGSNVRFYTSPVTRGGTYIKR